MKREEKSGFRQIHKMGPTDIMDFLKRREADKEEIKEMISTGVKSEVEIKLKPI